MAEIAFIGVGNMGSRMAANLLKHGHRLRVLDTLQTNVSRMTALGAAAAPDAATAAAGADVVISMLPSGRELRSIYLEAGGVIAAVGPEALLIDCSTADVETTRAVQAAAAARGIDMLDAPVSGGIAGAEAGSLTFMVGGPVAALERARPVLLAMGATVIHAGAGGAGQAAKICNNLILGISMIAVSEAFVLARHLGLAPEKLFEISAKSSGQCWSLTSYCPVPGLVPSAPSNRDYAPGFTAAMMLKDLRLAQEAGKDHDTGYGPEAGLAEAATHIYEQFVQAGGGNVDFSGIIRYLEQN